MAFDINGFIQAYYIQPILNHEGYNPVNTLTYALIALAAAFIIWGQFKKHKITVDREFFISTLPFILLGPTMRVVTDSIDTGVMQAHAGVSSGIIGSFYSFILSTHLYDYGFLTSSPGIYFVTAAILFASLFAQKFAERKFPSKSANLMRNVGIFLFLLHFLILLPMVSYPLYGLLIIALAGIIGFIARRFFSSALFARLSGSGLTQSHDGAINGGVGASNVAPDQAGSLAWLVVFAHSLDGAATFVTIDIFNRLEPACTLLGKCYGEQHVVSSFLGTFADTYLVFFAVKVIFSALVAFLVEKESQDRQEKTFIFLLLVVFGLAPGLRDLLRLATGA
ncbi:DUF63 family protein [Candidatus Parvarchaeota archaeon]|nr:DUF63 family protein [Candidatus Parvarchaeota archaeon]